MDRAYSIAERGTCTVDSGASRLKHARVPNLSGNRQHRALIALGRAIREVRLAKGISQEKLALLAEVDRSYVGRVERGDNNAATLTLVRIADALDTTVSKLMQRAGL
jgi:DNA-binding XRE family transcriptional regulator